MITLKFPLAFILIWLWVGFVCSISFLEAWLKFDAPGMTLAIGLGIGRIVFHALNKVECVLAMVIGIDLLWEKISFRPQKTLILAGAFMILLLQTGWLLPAMDSRIEDYLAGGKLPSSPLHFSYLLSEVLKVICLVIGGLFLMKKQAEINS
jgi:uncharacterized membrane protein (Fun14 family)